MCIINLSISAIREIRIPRYYRNERGFVTEFYRQLSPLIQIPGHYPEHTILETEVQKRRYDHFGVTQRPDLLIHIPIETGLTNRANENNFVVFAFKKSGNAGKSLHDFANLDEMFGMLNYSKGIYVNIGNYPKTFLHHYNGVFRSRIHELSIGLDTEKGAMICYSHYNNGNIVTEIV
jgi:hypothetical protein